jgi:hypothetical protein
MSSRIPPWACRAVVVPLVASRLMLTLVAWRAFQIFPRPVPRNDVLEIRQDGNRTVIGNLVAVLVLLRLRASYGIYVVLSLVFAIIWGMPIPVARFGLAMFPIMIALALLGRNPAFDRFYVIISTGLAAFFMIVFSQWGWVA